MHSNATMEAIAPLFLRLLIIASLMVATNSFIPNLREIAHGAKRSPSQLLEAPVTFQGTGAAAVDLNRYNLPIDVILQEWTANLVAQSKIRQEGEVYLGAKSGREYFADTVKIMFRRRRGEGLGIELEEIAGGRNDGLGITIVTRLVEGGPATLQDIMPGDCLASVGIVRKKRARDSGLSDTEETVSVATECLGYDATVAAIQSLPPIDSEDEWFQVTLKRLRRIPKVRVNLQYPPSQNETDTTIELVAGENLRFAMLVRGIKLNDPLAKRFDTKNNGNCGANGLCRTCAVSVVRGADLLSPQGTAEKQMLEDVPRWRLACKAKVGHGMKEGEVTIKVNPRQW
jgi:ferredoxin